MSALDERLQYKGFTINKTAASSGFLYRVRLVPFTMTSLAEAKLEINKLIARTEKK